MKNNFLMLLALFMVAICASAQVSLCGVYADDNGHFNSPYIKSGTITWDRASRTLTMNNAVVEYSSNNSYDGVNTIRVTEDATIVIHGECRLTNTGSVALSFDSNNAKNITIKGDGTLTASSSWLDMFLVVTRLTIQDITLNVAHGIGNNSEGNGVALTFDNIQASIRGGVSRIGEGVFFKNCAITSPADAYIGTTGVGYIIYSGNGSIPAEIIISRSDSGKKGDVNNDGEVNIVDVDSVIKIILGAESSSRADVNNDGEINIVDVDAIISIILGGGSSQEDHGFVDLGLPSGTLWATCNVGASAPEEYGNYYAWGETAPKVDYSWENYKFYNYSDEMTTVTKYCIHSDSGYESFTDGKTELDPEDDAAYVNWGPQWRMPTYEQLAELKDQCTWKSSTLNGVKGRMATGPNGNSIFLPNAGTGDGESILRVGTHGNYWSRTLYWNISYNAVDLGITTASVYGHNASRALGLTIRAVRVP